MKYLIIVALLLTGCSKPTSEHSPESLDTKGRVQCKTFPDGNTDCAVAQDGKVFEWQAKTPEEVKKENNS